MNCFIWFWLIPGVIAGALMCLFNADNAKAQGFSPLDHLFTGFFSGIFLGPIMLLILLYYFINDHWKWRD